MNLLKTNIYNKKLYPYLLKLSKEKLGRAAQYFFHLGEDFSVWLRPGSVQSWLTVLKI